MPERDFEWDEDRGGPEDNDNLISIPDEDPLYLATKGAMPWRKAGDHDQDRVTIPSIFLENLFGEAPVADPTSLRSHTAITRCLDLQHWLVPALDLLEANELLSENDEEGTPRDRTFENYDDLVRRADQLVKQLEDHADLTVEATSFDWVNGHNPSQATQGYNWMAGTTIEELTRTSRKLRHYLDFRLIIGPHSTEAGRQDTTSIFHTQVGATGGGQLANAIRAFYYPSQWASGAAIAPEFLSRRIPDFVRESQWPSVYRMHYNKQIDYAFDLPRRAAWRTATRLQWAALVQDRLAKAIVTHLPFLERVCRDYLGEADTLVREVQNLGAGVENRATARP